MNEQKEEKSKIKYRTLKQLCDPKCTEYLEDQKFQLGEHEFTPHYNRLGRNIPVDDGDYELLRFMIAYIQDKDTVIENNHYDHDDTNKFIQEKLNTLSDLIYKIDNNNNNIADFFENCFRKYNTLNSLVKCYIEEMPSVRFGCHYNTNVLKQIQASVRNGNYDILLKEFLCQ